ncbi:DUF1949 domain-containing protein [bacterium]|nr:DUF1949 domain-containing protein [bacterium]
MQKEITKELTLNYTYDQVSTVQYLFSKYETKIISEKYDENINQIINVNIALYDGLIKDLIDKQVEFIQ